MLEAATKALAPELRVMRDRGQIHDRAGLAILFGFLAPALLIYAAFTLYPVLRTFYNAFHAIKPQGVVEFVGVGNFKTLLFDDPVFWKAVVNTSLFTLGGANIGFQLGGIVGHKFLSKYRVGIDIERSVLRLKNVS